MWERSARLAMVPASHLPDVAAGHRHRPPIQEGPKAAVEALSDHQQARPLGPDLDGAATDADQVGPAPAAPPRAARAPRVTSNEPAPGLRSTVTPSRK